MKSGGVAVVGDLNTKKARPVNVSFAGVDLQFRHALHVLLLLGHQLLVHLLQLLLKLADRLFCVPVHLLELLHQRGHLRIAVILQLRRQHGLATINGWWLFSQDNLHHQKRNVIFFTLNYR